MIFVHRATVLSVHSSSRDGNSQPTILPAVLTTRCILLLSRFVALPYHTQGENVSVLLMVER